MLTDMEYIAGGEKSLQVVFHRSEISARMGVELLTGGILFAREFYHCRPRVRNDFLILLTLHGAAWVREGARRRNLQAGDWFVLRPGIEHEYDCVSPWSFAYAHANGALLRRLVEQLAFFRNENLGFRQRSHHGKMLLVELVKRGAAATSGAEAACNALLIQLLVILQEDRLDEKRRSDNLALARKFMEEHCGEPLRLADIAAAAGMSPYHFCRMFNAAAGLPPLRYLQKYRIEQAGRILQTPGASIGDAAESAGFADRLYFSKVFRKWTGMTPSEYRALVQHQD